MVKEFNNKSRRFYTIPHYDGQVDRKYFSTANAALMYSIARIKIAVLCSTLV